MKSILRKILFSALALYTVAFIDKGLKLNLIPVKFIVASCIVGILHYIIRPVLKVVLLPLNFITFGIASIIVYAFLFYLFASKFGILSITSWQFEGLNKGFIHIGPFLFPELINVVLISFVISAIISLLDFFL